LAVPTSEIRLKFIDYATSENNVVPLPVAGMREAVNNWYRFPAAIRTLSRIAALAIFVNNWLAPLEYMKTLCEGGDILVFFNYRT